MCFPQLLAPFAAIGKAVGGAVGAGAANLGTAGLTSVGLQTVGGLVGAFGQYQNARAAGKAASMNAAAAEKASREQYEAGQKESDKLQRQAALSQGTIRAQMAANGIDPGSGDALSFLQEQQELATEDAFTIRENARRVAQNQSTDAANYRAEASSARSASFFGPMGTLLTTGAKVGEKYAGWAAQGAY